ncbi:MAG: hypothetical protein K8H86_04785 [Ignavibacteriaceae bacterium]|nr:hypothetical protein [Ignavibacteriaceae bacterium]
MSKFTYKFESIIKVKESLEKKAQKDVAEIDLLIEKQKEEYEKIVEEGKNSQHDFSYKKVHASELQFIKAYEADIKEQLCLIMQKIEQLEIKKDEKMIELIERTKEHKIFEILKDNHREQFRVDENKVDMDSINEMATQKYIRGSK